MKTFGISARTLGQLAQGILLGLLLMPALFELAVAAGGLSVFQYQGF